MKFSIAFLLAFFVAFTQAISNPHITKPHLITGQNKQYIDLSDNVGKVELNYNEKELLKFQFEYNSKNNNENGNENENENQPQHVSLTLAVGDKIEQSYLLKKQSDSNEYSWLQQTNQLPRALVYQSLKHSTPITAKLYLKSLEDDVAIVGAPLFEIEFIEATIPKPVLNKIAESRSDDAFLKKEIVHQFQQAPKQANKFIVTLFSVAVVVAAFFTLSSWIISIDFKKHITVKKSCGTLTYFSVFLLGIIGLEYSFYQYYLGNNDIFNTLYNVFILFTLPTVLSGARLLKRLY